MYTRTPNRRGPRRSFSPSSMSRKPYGGSRFGQSQRRRPSGERIDFSRFINKAVITEEVDHFIPEHKFQDFAIDQHLKRAIATRGYDKPTPIQDRTIPHILRGSDLVGIANTGTGKTAAFLIPLIHKVRQSTSEHALIIVPTRELAIQIDQELKDLTRGMKIFSACCVGGMNIRPQIQALRYRHNFIIGTPGRLKDLIDRRIIHLSDIRTVVLDEADRMLDMGFIADMRFVMAGMPKERQTLFFAATFSSEVERFVKEFLRDPVRISVKTRDTSKNVDQNIVRIGRDQIKIEVLHDLLNQKELSKVLIFGRTKHGVEKLSKVLIQRGFSAESIHGNKNHAKRQRALGLFKNDRIKILVATDVAARGIDIADVSHVINYDLPETYDDYVHRIGRTGRGDKKGKALTFVG